MKVERIIHPTPEPTIVLTLTITEAEALRKVLYRSDLAESIPLYFAIVPYVGVQS